MHREKLRASDGAQFFGRLERCVGGWRASGFARIHDRDSVMEEPEAFEATTRQEVITWLTQTALLRGFPTWHLADDHHQLNRRRHG